MYRLSKLFIRTLTKDSPINAGRRGEEIVVNAIQKHIDDEKYKAIHDITIPSRSGTTQIDHIIVSVYGIFVIETKNWQGWVFGGKNQKSWTQVNRQYKNKFMNPLRQNYGHVKALQSILNLPMSTFHSVVVFAENGEFKTPMPVNVIYAHELNDYISSKKIKMLEKTDVDVITNQIKSNDYGEQQPVIKSNTEVHRDTDKIEYSGSRPKGAFIFIGLLVIIGAMILLSDHPTQDSEVINDTKRKVAPWVYMGGDDTTYLIYVPSKNNFGKTDFLELAKYICEFRKICTVMFWEEKQNMPMSLQLTDKQVDTKVAQYNLNKDIGMDRLLICGVGGC